MAWPDAVALVTAYLRPIVAPVRVASRPPQDSATRAPLLQVRRIGGQALPPVRDVPRLDVFAWGPDDEQAWALGLAARSALWLLPGTTALGVTCYRIEEFMGPRQQDDPTSLTPRVWATYELHLRADEAIQPAA